MSNDETWYTADEGKVHEIIVDTITELITRRGSETLKDLEAWYAMYMDRPNERFEDIGFSRYGKSSNNVLAGDVEATHASLITTRPKAKVHTIGGDWSIRQRVKLMNRWSDGEWERLDLHEKMDRQVLDGMVYGAGLIKLSPRHGRPYAERVPRRYVTTDPVEEEHSCVRSLYQYAAKDRASMIALYPDHAKTIEGAKSISELESGTEAANTERVADLVALVEAWRLPDGSGEPGRHVICIEGVDLLDEEWKHDRFPFSIFNWGIDPERFFGQGMIERGAGPQSELNELCRVVKESYEGWFPMWLFPEGGKAPTKMSDELGRGYYFDPALGPPQYYTPGAVGGEVPGQIAMLEGRVHARVGVSGMDSAGEESAHQMSGKARLVQKDTRSIRFGVQGKAYERACRDLQQILMLVANDCADAPGAKPDALDVYEGDKVLELIKFGDARLKKDTVYRVRTEAVSQMADTFSGRLEQVNILQQTGIIEDPARLERLLGEPDLAADGDRSQAARDIVDRAIEACLDGEATAAHAYMDTSYAVSRSIQELNLAEMQGAPEDGLEHLRNFIGHVMAIDDKKKQAQIAAMQPPPPDPMAGAAMDPMAGDPMGAAPPADGALPPG